MKNVRFWGGLFVVLAVSLLGLVSGCSAVNQAQGYLGEAVTMYCSQPAEQRAGIRSAVNARAFPNAVKIDCAQDQIAPVPTPASEPNSGSKSPDGSAAMLDSPEPFDPAVTRVADGRPPGLAARDPGEGDDDEAALTDPGDDPEPVPA
jgi:hypothetical protein